ncbi:hypothetical protein GALL_409970 [mine drainage metagenome]|uniref:Uncharacterized protein n=1 Tax=mine drainage metagenome TaxID=410659 RepID=A0A1J5Q210_9ZZZZ
MYRRGRFQDFGHALGRSGVGSLYLGELALSLTVLGCIIRVFNDQVSTDGLSYYGVHRETIPILIVGLSVCMIWFLRASRQFDAPGLGHSVSKSIRIFMIAVLMIYLTPYSINNDFDLAHRTIGTLLFLWQLALSLDWTLGRARDPVSWLAIALELTGGLIALLALSVQTHGYQFEGQLIFQIGFFMLLNHVSKELRPVSKGIVSSSS